MEVCNSLSYCYEGSSFNRIFHSPDEVQSVIIDAGSCSMRFGTSGQDIPRHVFKSVIFDRCF